MECNSETAQVGESVYIDGQFAGALVENLSDPLMSQADMVRLTNKDPYGYVSCGHSLSGFQVPTAYYDLRTVYSRRFGTVCQALVKSIGGPAYINLPANAGFSTERT